jgi:hypothetical protein
MRLRPRAGARACTILGRIAEHSYPAEVGGEDHISLRRVSLLEADPVPRPLARRADPEDRELAILSDTGAFRRTFGSSPTTCSAAPASRKDRRLGATAIILRTNASCLAERLQNLRRASCDPRDIQGTLCGHTGNNGFTIQTVKDAWSSETRADVQAHDRGRTSRDYSRSPVS